MDDCVNPFLNLIDADNKKNPSENNLVNMEMKISEAEKEIGTLLGDIFLITLVNNKDKSKYFLDYSNMRPGQIYLDTGLLNTGLFERLMSSLKDANIENEAHEKDAIKYLGECYCRLQILPENIKTKCQNILDECKKLIMDHAKLIFINPNLFELSQPDPCKTLFEFLYNGMSLYNEEDYLFFFNQVIEDIYSEESGQVFEYISPVLDHLYNECCKLKLSSSNISNCLNVLNFFTSKIHLTMVLLRHITPQDMTKGISFEKNLLGMLLNLGCQVESTSSEYFELPDQMTQSQVANIEATIHSSMMVLQDRLHQIFLRILKFGSQIKNDFLVWISNCINANSGRRQMWTQEMPLEVLRQTYVSDAFLINLTSIFLRIAAPFTSDPANQRLFKIQNTYIAATLQPDALAKNVHMLAFKDAALLPSENVKVPALDNNYTFQTECFYLCHMMLAIGFKASHDRLNKITQNLQRIQDAWMDVRQQGNTASEMGETIKDAMEKSTMLFLSQKAMLSQPEFLDSSFSFLVSSATYLVHVAISSPDPTLPLVFPLPTNGSTILSFMPEYLVENVQDFMLFVRRYKDEIFEQKREYLPFLWNFVLAFMGSPQFLRNPHLRAGFAETLECLLPHNNNSDSPFTQSSCFYREQLMTTHKHIDHLAEALIGAFVAMELTGQGVQFELKFRYRQPMYVALSYIWKLDRHRNAIQELSTYAESHMEDTNAPLFLRFINLLTNDAIYLLDEALSLMNQIKEKQEASREWSKLSRQQRIEQESSLQHMGMLARFHNTMGNETIGALEMLTAGMPSVFLHHVMLERIASMLNYFLLHLVGPKKRNLVVKDPEKFSFDPRTLVASICRIYCNLGFDENFHRAVVMDGRSYSKDLLTFASDVLCRIKRPFDEISRFENLAENIRKREVELAIEDEMLEDCPEEFLDPIMGSLMRDPVLLPSSGKIVDRQTIARHILSDQFDPFNRQPLTMDMVQPALPLKHKIDEWIKQQQNKSKMDTS